MYSRSPINLQQAEATGSDNCPVVTRRLVGPAENTSAANRIAASFVPPPKLEQLLRDINHCVRQRPRNLVAASAEPHLKHCEV